MELDIAQNLTNKANEKGTVNKFIEELNGVIKNEHNLNIVDKSEKYMDYWDYQKFMEDNVSATIGLSRWDNDITYSNELQKAVEESILELSEREGHIYEAFEDDGYIFLNDLTEERDFSIEDIDFVVDCYEGDGTYQVIDGEYRKIED